jgi:hypothetical protein
MRSRISITTCLIPLKNDYRAKGITDHSVSNIRVFAQKPIEGGKIAMPIKYRKTILFICIIGSFLFLSSTKVFAVPSFERQTGMSCTACHTVFPELTPFGRAFKLGGYIFSRSSKDKLIPVAGMVQAAFTDTKGLNTGVTPFDDSPNNNINLPQQASLFYGGRIINKLGALVQLTYTVIGNELFLDNTDIRYVNNFLVGGKNLLLGISVNNNPTVQDIWNTTPAWGFPYASSDVATTPSAGTIIDGALGQQVGGIGLYAFWNDLVYGEVTVYRGTRRGITRPLGVGTTTEMVVDDLAPYWRFALQHKWKEHYLSVGTYGMVANIFPEGSFSGPSDRFTDTALDGQYQYLSKKHIFSIETTWIHEDQDWNASFALGNTENRSDSLDTFKINSNYYYRSNFGTIGGSLGYFSTTGDKDTVLYSPDPVDGSRTGSPDSNGFILEADYLPFEKGKVSLQYVIYNKFNGARTNYDGSGRDASDNNTLYLVFWLMF